MADAIVHQQIEEQDYHKARSILNGMINYRINPVRIKTTQTEPNPNLKGGQGTVVVATLVPADGSSTPEPEQTVAVKKLEWNRKDAKESVKFFKSFVTELSVMKVLSHPNIIQLVGFVEDVQKGDAWIVLPWEGNGNVREFLRSGEWDIPERVSLIKDTINGLVYLHTRQPPICHGDLKSPNILVNSSCQAVITDFGSARVKRTVAARNGDSPSELPIINDVSQGSTTPKIEITFDPSTLELTLTGPGFSLRWAAPEVLNNGVQDLPSDLWAMGWICWEIVTGKIPFEEINRQGPIIVHTIKGKLPAIRDESRLSQILQLCSLMSDCWIAKPTGRIDALTLQRKIAFMPSATPSGSASDGPKVRSAALLVQLGEMHRIQGNNTESKSYFQSAIEIATQTRDNTAKANALDGLGRVHRESSNLCEAEKALKESREIHSRLENDFGAANALEGLGHIYHTQTRNQEAEEAFKESHGIHARIGNNLGAANALDGLGRVYCTCSKDLEAESAFKEAYGIYARIGVDLGAANALDGLGEIYRVHSRNQEATEAFEEAHRIQTRIGNALGAANALEGLGHVYRAQSRKQEAEKIFRELCEIHTRVGNDLGLGNALDGLGRIHASREEYREAEKALAEAHEIQARIGNDLGAANALEGLGDVYSAEKKYREAENLLRSAHEIHSRIGNDLGAGNALRGLGEICFAEDRYEEAEMWFGKALDAYASNDDGESRARALVNLGDVYHAQGKYFEAKSAISEALAISISLSDDDGQVDALKILVEIFKSQSKHDEEARVLDQLGEALARIGSHASRAEVAEQSGGLHLAQAN